MANLACALVVVCALAISADASELRSAHSIKGPLAGVTRVSIATAPPPASPMSRVADAMDALGARVNKASFDLNLWLGSAWRSVGPAQDDGGGAGASTGTVDEALSNLLLHWVNEPLTVLGYAFAGRMEQSWQSSKRFAINTVQGWGGLVDAATEQGVTVPRVDFGLTMCALGVREGPYTVIPIVGPRTLRDAFADLVVTNAIFYVALIPVIGMVPPVETVLLIIVVDELLNLALARQVDSIAMADVQARGYDAIREIYLADRRERCAALRAM